MCWPILQIDSLVISLFFRSGKICFSGVSLSFAGGLGEVVSLELGCWYEGGGYAVLLRLHRWEAADLGPRQHGYVLRSTCTTTCALLRAACMFIDSQSLIVNGALLDLSMVEARYFFWHASRRHWTWATAVGFDGCRKP
jgi:hypothetical protein